MRTATASPVIETRRLARAVSLEAVLLGSGRYRVTGGSTSHEVDLERDWGAQCDCPDYVWRGNVCKQVLAARLHEGDPGVIRALRVLVSEGSGE